MSMWCFAYTARCAAVSRFSGGPKLARSSRNASQLRAPDADRMCPSGSRERAKMLHAASRSHYVISPRVVRVSRRKGSARSPPSREGVHASRQSASSHLHGRHPGFASQAHASSMERNTACWRAPGSDITRRRLINASERTQVGNGSEPFRFGPFSLAIFPTTLPSHSPSDRIETSAQDDHRPDHAHRVVPGQAVRHFE